MEMGLGIQLGLGLQGRTALGPCLFYWSGTGFATAVLMCTVAGVRMFVRAQVRRWARESVRVRIAVISGSISPRRAVVQSLGRW